MNNVNAFCVAQYKKQANLHTKLQLLKKMLRFETMYVNTAPVLKINKGIRDNILEIKQTIDNA